MGFDNVIVTNENSFNLSKAFSGYFDLVVIDAPCSGEGMFRKSDISILLEEVNKEYEHLKELNK